ncbi:hypothetical protein AVEN_168194-1 [Araneus ventricosus]|uniref:Uncharacterized protein n=1 Tax=Araneus ventricosus TaxID=182803 RepID=A0A4Y2QGV6_ARAVE|nr:hypothetical protein AVEN_168194-1 [Araneus ventricosus]
MSSDGEAKVKICSHKLEKLYSIFSTITGEKATSKKQKDAFNDLKADILMLHMDAVSKVTSVQENGADEPNNIMEMFIDLKREFSSFRIDINTKINHISKQIAPESIARQPELQEPTLHEELVKANLKPEVKTCVSAVRNSSSTVKRVKSDSKLVINGASKTSSLKSVDYVFARTVPLKRAITKKFPFWYSVETRRLLRRKEIVRRLLLRHRNPVFIDEFRSLRTSVKFCIKRDYGNYLHPIEKDLISEPKKFWSHFKKDKNNNHLPDKLYYNDKCFTSDIDIANAYADYFCSVFKPSSEYDSNDSVDFNGFGDFVGWD